MVELAGGPGTLAPAHIAALTGGRSISRIVYSVEDIAARVRTLGDEITRAYEGEDDLLVLGLLKGSFIFLSDLVRCISRPVQVDFLVASSYGAGTTSSGQVELLYQPAAPLTGRNVILVEDIVDSGNTLNRMMEALDAHGLKSLEICALLHKNIAPHLAREARWVGFDAPPDFLVGYGLDHAEDFRHLPFIASLSDQE